MRYVFGDYTLDVARRELRCQGHAVPLRPQVFDLLVSLVTHHDRAVAKQELLTGLWPNLHVSPATLSACIKLVRQAVARAQEEHFYEAEVYRLKGELLWARAAEDHAAVEASFRQALAIARRQQAKSLELRAAMSLARLWQQQGRRAEAHALLAPVYGWFTEGFDTADLQEAKVLLDA